MKCIVCNKEIASPLRPCPRCGFLQPAVVGDAAGAEAFIAAKAEKHKRDLLANYDFGLTVYHFKDQDGTVVPDQEERLSFGKGDALLGEPVWLDQKFARIPEADTMELELSVQLEAEAVEKIPVTVPVPQGRHLQQVGALIGEDLSIKLLLKNPEEQTQSDGIPFLGD